jgi:hypothetical protein
MKCGCLEPPAVYSRFFHNEVHVQSLAFRLKPTSSINPAINFTPHGAHYTTYVHLERHTRIRAPAASHRRLNPQHSDAPHYIRTRSYVYFHYKHIACTTCPIPLIMIHTSQIPATRRGCRSRDLKISGRRRARRDHASDVAEIMSGRYCEGVVLQDEGEAGPGRE